MVGPYLRTARGAAGLAASTASSCAKIWGAAGVGPNFRILGRGDRLCRRLGGLHSWGLEERCEMKTEESGERDGKE